MKTTLTLVAALSLLTGTALACSFQYDPASVPRFYRSEGWTLPGMSDDPSVKPDAYGAPPVSAGLAAIPGIRAQLLRRSEIHVRFPEQVFSVGNDRKRMRSFLAKAVIIRWELNGKIVAYTYGLIPISKATKRHGKWIYEGEVGCIFYGTFIDDNGDGVFRVLVPDTLLPQYLPKWAKPEGA